MILFDWIIISIILLIIVGIVIKITIINPARIRELFEELQSKGHSRIDTNDPAVVSAIHNLALKLVPEVVQARSITSIHHGVTHNQHKSMRYLCDISIPGYHKVNRMIIAETGSFSIDEEIYVRRKHSGTLFSEKISQDIIKVNVADLDPKFAEKFAVFLKSGSDIKVPHELQFTLTNCVSNFPFKKTRYTAYFSKDTWGIAFPRTSNKHRIYELIETANQISNALHIRTFISDYKSTKKPKQPWD
jgi:hypothetical protein